MSQSNTKSYNNLIDQLNQYDRSILQQLEQEQEAIQNQYFNLDLPDYYNIPNFELDYHNPDD